MRPILGRICGRRLRPGVPWARREPCEPGNHGDRLAYLQANQHAATARMARGHPGEAQGSGPPSRLADPPPSDAPRHPVVALALQGCPISEWGPGPKDHPEVAPALVWTGSHNDPKDRRMATVQVGRFLHSESSGAPGGWPACRSADTIRDGSRRLRAATCHSSNRVGPVM